MQQRRASVYIVVLMTAMIVGVIGLAALSRSRVEFRTTRESLDFQQSRLLARSAIEVGLELLESRTDWRSTLSSGSRWLQNALAGGGFDLYGSDPIDGNFANNTTDPLRLLAVGRVGSAAFGWQADFQSVDEPLEALKSALHCVGNLTVASGNTLTVSGAPATTNAALQIQGAISGAAEGMSISGGGSVSGGVRVPTVSRKSPPSTIVSTYTAKATAISFATAGNNIRDIVLSRALNPYGKPDKDGLYVIDTGGSNLRIRNSRIDGTLVVLAKGATLTIDGSVYFKNYRATYPTLIVDGNLELKFDSTSSISELALGDNFNPVGAPYQGSSDSDLLDVYPCGIQGFVHCTGNVTFSDRARINGTLLAEGAVAVNANGSAVYDPNITIDLPEGYTAPGPLRPVAGSWRRAETLP